MNCLLITNPQRYENEIISFLEMNHVEYDLAENQLVGIEKVHQRRFDVVVMDADQSRYQIDQAIRILKDCNPHVRIIVRTELNSRELETQVRKEHIFYYHVNSFGQQELTTALRSALELYTAN